MNDLINIGIPDAYVALASKCEEYGFEMPSDLHVGALLKTLVASKPNARVLELGTGIGFSLVWMRDGLDDNSHLITIDNDPKLSDLANQFFGQDPRVDIICQDGDEWISNYQGEKFDLIFADAWPGKYSLLNETLELLKVGGLYIVDDMSFRSDWPDGHAQKAEQLIALLEIRKDLAVVKMDWSTGIIICTKKF